MDNLTHTLLGLSAAKAGLERATPLAATTLVISSNLPDIDVLTSMSLAFRDPIAGLEHHRGFTHSFVGLAVLAAALTAALLYLDRRFRLRGDHRRRPLRPMRIFGLAYLGGLGHLFMDFTNSYGVRPLLPFSGRWFYGDMVFVADPWIWLILGSTVVWLTATEPPRVLFWSIVGVILAVVVAVALRDPSDLQPALPLMSRVIWFAGLAVVLLGAVLRWGRRGSALARYSLFALTLYYGAMWMAHESALQRAWATAPPENIKVMAAWPAPANPSLWRAAAGADTVVYTRAVDLTTPLPESAAAAGKRPVPPLAPTEADQWTANPRLDPAIDAALRRWEVGRVFLDFARFTATTVETRPEGYHVSIRDLRFNLHLTAVLDREMNVESIDVGWF